MVRTRGAVAARTPAEVALLLAEQAVASARVQAEAEANEAARQLARRVDPTLYFIDRLPNELLLIIFEFALESAGTNEYNPKHYVEQKIRRRLIGVCWRWRVLANTNADEYVLRTSSQTTRLGVMLQASIKDRDALVKKRKEEKAKTEVDLVDVVGSMETDGTQDKKADVEKVLSCRADEVKVIRVLYEADPTNSRDSEGLAQVLAMTPNVEVLEFLDGSWSFDVATDGQLISLLAPLQNARNIRRFVMDSEYYLAELPPLVANWLKLEELVLPFVYSHPFDYLDGSALDALSNTHLTTFEFHCFHDHLKDPYTAAILTRLLISSATTLTTLQFNVREDGHLSLIDDFFDAIPSTLHHLTAIIESHHTWTILDAVLLRSTRLKSLTLSDTGYSNFSCLAKSSTLKELSLVLRCGEIERSAMISDLISRLDVWKSLRLIQVDFGAVYGSVDGPQASDLAVLKRECESREIRLDSSWRSWNL